MRRRQFLAALPLTGAFAGCIGGSDPVASTESRVPSSTDEASPNTATGTSTSQETVAAVLRASYRYVHNNDAIGVETPTHAQFAFVRPPNGDEEHPPHEYALELGGERVGPAGRADGFMSWTPGVESVYTDERRSDALKFDVPAIRAENAALTHGDRRWPLTDPVRDRLAAAPDLRLESLDVPESVDRNERIELGVTVTNEGDRTGTYLGGFRRGGYPQDIDARVAPGETGSDHVTYERVEGEGSIPFVFTGHETSEHFSVTVGSGTESS